MSQELTISGNESTSSGNTPTAFQKHNFRSGQILTASALNEIENEITRLGQEGGGSGSSNVFVVEFELDEDDNLTLSPEKIKSIVEAHEDGKAVLAYYKSDDLEDGSTYIMSYITAYYYNPNIEITTLREVAPGTDSSNDTEGLILSTAYLTFSSNLKEVSIVYDHDEETVDADFADYIYDQNIWYNSGVYNSTHGKTAYLDYGCPNCITLNQDLDSLCLTAQFNQAKGRKIEAYIDRNGHSIADINMIYQDATDKTIYMYGSFSPTRTDGIIKITLIAQKDDDGNSYAMVEEFYNEAR